MSRTVNVNEEFVVVSKGKEDLGKFAVLGDGGKFDPSTIPVIDGLQEQVTKEVTERTEGDKVLQTNIDTETSARISDDQQLQGNIEAEASARASADKDLQDQISKEITARTDGDTALQSSVDKEVAARTDADSKLQSSIDTEVDARTKADQSLQEKIDVLEGKNAFSNVVVNGITIKATSQEDTIELEAGTNIALTADTANEKVTIAVNGKVASAEQADSATTAESCTGNSATATKLETARNINGVAFDGTKDITITATANGGNADNANTVGGYTPNDLMPLGAILMWSGSIANIPSKWALCNGSNGTPNLLDRMVVCAGNSYAAGATGGEAMHTLTVAEMPSHKHSYKLDYEYVSGGSNMVADESGAGLPGGAYPTQYTDSIGDGSAHNNMPPYYALAYIMRIA